MDEKQQKLIKKIESKNKFTEILDKILNPFWSTISDKKFIFSLISGIVIVYSLLISEILGIPISIYNANIIENIILTVGIILVVTFLFIISLILSPISLIFLMLLIFFALLNNLFLRKNQIFKLKIKKIFSFSNPINVSFTLINLLKLFFTVLFFLFLMSIIEPLEIILYKAGAPTRVLNFLENYKLNITPQYIKIFRDYNTFPQFKQIKGSTRTVVILNMNNNLIYYYDICELLNLYKPLFSIIENKLQAKENDNENLKYFCNGVTNFYDRKDYDSLLFHIFFTTPAYIWIKECHSNNSNCINNIFPLEGKSAKIINIKESKNFINKLHRIKELDNSKLKDQIESLYEKCKNFKNSKSSFSHQNPSKENK